MDKAWKPFWSGPRAPAEPVSPGPEGARLVHILSSTSGLMQTFHLAKSLPNRRLNHGSDLSFCPFLFELCKCGRSQQNRAGLRRPVRLLRHLLWETWETGGLGSWQNDKLKYLWFFWKLWSVPGGELLITVEERSGDPAKSLLPPRLTFHTSRTKPFSFGFIIHHSCHS